MSGDDDKTPMLQHELPAVTTSRDPEDSARPRAGVATFRRSRSTTLAVVAFILFACALVFLIVSLIIPIIHSVNLMEEQRVKSSNNTGNASLPAAAGHSTDHQHRRRRSASDAVDTLKRILAARCACLSLLQTSELKQSAERQRCLRTCLNLPHGKINYRR